MTQRTPKHFESDFCLCFISQISRREIANYFPICNDYPKFPKFPAKPHSPLSPPPDDISQPALARKTPLFPLSLSLTPFGHLPFCFFRKNHARDFSVRAATARRLRCRAPVRSLFNRVGDAPTTTQPAAEKRGWKPRGTDTARKPDLTVRAGIVFFFKMAGFCLQVVNVRLGFWPLKNI